MSSRGATRHGYEQLWAANDGPAVNFYRRCGWQVHELVERSPHPTVTVLTRRCEHQIAVPLDLPVAPRGQRLTVDSREKESSRASCFRATSTSPVLPPAHANLPGKHRQLRRVTGWCASRSAEADGSSSAGLALVRQTRQLWSSHGEPLPVHGGRAPWAGNSRRSPPSKSRAASGRAGSKVSSSPLNGRSAELTSTARARSSLPHSISHAAPRS